MKTLTIGNTTLELNDFVKKWDKIAGVYAVITIPTSAISYSDLKVLFKDNQSDIIVTEENGDTETFSGYGELDSIRENVSDGVYVVTQYCTETALHLLNETRKRIAEQNAVIEQQTVIVGALEETSVIQMATIESLLLEVIPAVIAEALASNSMTE